MKLFHIPSGYPSRHNAVAGISAKDYFLAFSEHFVDVQNTVSLIYETSFEFLIIVDWFCRNSNYINYSQSKFFKTI